MRCVHLSCDLDCENCMFFSWMCIQVMSLNSQYESRLDWQKRLTAVEFVGAIDAINFGVALEADVNAGVVAGELFLGHASYPSAWQTINADSITECWKTSLTDRDVVGVIDVIDDDLMDRVADECDGEHSCEQTLSGECQTQIKFHRGLRDTSSPWNAIRVHTNDRQTDRQSSHSPIESSTDCHPNWANLNVNVARDVSLCSLYPQMKANSGETSAKLRCIASTRITRRTAHVCERYANEHPLLVVCGQRFATLTPLIQKLWTTPTHTETCGHPSTIGPLDHAQSFHVCLHISESFPMKKLVIWT